MKDNDTTREQMDACRPGKLDEMCPEMSDLAAALEHDIELREVFARSQQVDQRIQQAYQEVTVPDGLADRLLASLEAAATTSSPIDHLAPRIAANTVDTSPVSPRETQDATRVVSRQPTTRRQLLWGAGALIAASLACAAMYYNNVFHPQLTLREICELTPGWLRQLPEDRWQSEKLEALLQHVPPALGPVHWSSWQPARTPLGKTQVLAGAYQNSRVFLLISNDHRASKLPTAPPATPVSVTGRFSIGVWSQGDHVYVLAIEGNERAYHRALRKFETFM